MEGGILERKNEQEILARRRRLNENPQVPLIHLYYIISIEPLMM